VPSEARDYFSVGTGRTEAQGGFMEIIIKRLPSGYYHIRGEGPCNWAQVQTLPCSEKDLRAGSFQVNDDFISSAMDEINIICSVMELVDEQGNI